MERVKGIEPSLSAWEAEVLPLNYTRVGQSAARILLRPAGRGQGFLQGAGRMRTNYVYVAAFSERATGICTETCIL